MSSAPGCHSLVSMGVLPSSLTDSMLCPCRGLSLWIPVAFLSLEPIWTSCHFRPCFVLSRLSELRWQPGHRAWEALPQLGEDSRGEFKGTHANQLSLGRISSPWFMDYSDLSILSGSYKFRVGTLR